MSRGPPTTSRKRGLTLLRLLLDEDVARNIADPKTEAGERQPRRLAEKKDVTIRISETTRTLAFGSLASCYALLFANSDLATIFSNVKPVLLWSAGLGILAIIVDGAQYLFAFVNVQQALAADDQLYPRNGVRRGRAICFILKQVLAYLAALLLLVSLALALFAPAQGTSTPSVTKAMQRLSQTSPIKPSPAEATSSLSS
jgi:hypothetical protein